MSKIKFPSTIITTILDTKQFERTSDSTGETSIQVERNIKPIKQDKCDTIFSVQNGGFTYTKYPIFLYENSLADRKTKNGHYWMSIPYKNRPGIDLLVPATEPRRFSFLNMIKERVLSYKELVFLNTDPQNSWHHIGVRSCSEIIIQLPDDDKYEGKILNYKLDTEKSKCSEVRLDEIIRSIQWRLDMTQTDARTEYRKDFLFIENISFVARWPSSSVYVVQVQLGVFNYEVLLRQK